MQGGPDIDRLASSVLEIGERIVPELVLLGMARSRVEDGVDTDRGGNDPCLLRSRYYNTLLAAAFGNLLSSPTRRCVCSLMLEAVSGAFMAFRCARFHLMLCFAVFRRSSTMRSSLGCGIFHALSSVQLF
jgi:hypothetical protein